MWCCVVRKSSFQLYCIYAGRLHTDAVKLKWALTHNTTPHLFYLFTYLWMHILWFFLFLFCSASLSVTLWYYLIWYDLLYNLILYLIIRYCAWELSNYSDENILVKENTILDMIINIILCNITLQCTISYYQIQYQIIQ